MMSGTTPGRSGDDQAGRRRGGSRHHRMSVEHVEVISFDGHIAFDYHHHAVVRPHVDALFTPSGRRITRELATAPADSDDHAHHKGVWWGHRDVDGCDVWTEFEGHGAVRSVSDPTVHTRYGHVELRHVTEWVTHGGLPLLTDVRVLRAWRPDDRGVQTLDMLMSARAASVPVHFSDTKEAGLVAVRVNPQIEERRGGRITLSTGAVGEAEAWGRAAAWCDYSGSVDGEIAGIAIFDHPSNPLPARWHVRDYGLMAVNPFGLRDFGEPDARGDVTITADTPFVSRYRLLAHDGRPDLAAYYASWVEEGV